MCDTESDCNYRGTQIPGNSNTLGYCENSKCM